MPSRIIRDSVPTSPDLDALTDGAERLFWHMVVRCDDHGRFDADPRVVLAAAFPLKIGRLKLSTVEEWLVELTTDGPGGNLPLVILYEVSGRRYGYFPSWFKHQRRRESKPKFPAPEEGTLTNPKQNAAIRRNPPQVAAYSVGMEPRAESRKRDAGEGGQGGRTATKEVCKSRIGNGRDRTGDGKGLSSIGTALGPALEEINRRARA